MPRPTSTLTFDFAQRLIEDLSSNNVLRGSWAEQLVAHFLDIRELPPNWSYFDMRNAAGRPISVKHSVGPKANFSVDMSVWAWDPDLNSESRATEGWRGGDHIGPQYWCDYYVFAWLPTGDTPPSRDEVLDADRWLFATLGRADMYRSFTGPGGGQRTAGLKRIESIAPFRPGADLPDSIERAITVGHDTPALRADISHASKLGLPIGVISLDPLPSSLVPDLSDNATLPTEKP